MSIRLIIFSILFSFLFILYIFYNINKDELNIKNSIIWIILAIGIVFCSTNLEFLKKISRLVGIETISNMLFFIGFMFLIYTCFNITKIVSKQNKKIINLEQEISILRKKYDEKNNK